MGLGNLTWGKTTKPFKLGHASPEVERARQIQKLMDEGMRTPDIAECLGIKRSAVSNAITAYGLKRK